MIFYLNLFKAIKFALKVINMNRPAPDLQLALGTNYDVEIVSNNTFFLQLIQLRLSSKSVNCELWAGK